MATETNQLHVAFFPLMAHGHTIPILDMAKLFSSRGVRTTIICTPLDAPLISKTIERTERVSGIKIHIHVLEFPFEEGGSKEPFTLLFAAVRLLKEPFEKFLQEHRPDCVIADMFYHWSTDIAAKYGIPRLTFSGTCFFAMCAAQCVNLYQPHKNVSLDTEPFVIPSLPGEIKMTRKMLPDIAVQNEETDLVRLFKHVQESELKSYGLVVNSFFELEPDYADYYRNVLGKKAWHVGPVSLCNRDMEEKVQRGEQPSINEHDCLKWLDSKNPKSVLYVSFGTLADFDSFQLKEIAEGLEASGQHFIWAVKGPSKEKMNNGEHRLPEGFENRMEGKGLIIKGWAPQVLILEHESVGGFVTHCGWNSILEAICAGVPMVTWPVAAEQFYNEKLLTQVLRIGVSVGAQQWISYSGNSCVKKEAIEQAIAKLMVGAEAEDISKRTRVFKDMARKAIEEGGSSYSDLNALLGELEKDGPPLNEAKKCI